MENQPEDKHNEYSGPEFANWTLPLPERLPQPTAWPAVLAFGSCLLFWGILTSWVISMIGLIIFLAGSGGWIWRMRDEQPK